MPDKHYVTIKGAVWVGDKLLLQEEWHQDKPGEIVWDLPGGRIDAGEDIIEGMKREVREELGVEVTEISPVPVKVWSTTGGGHGVVALLYEMKLSSHEFKVDNNEVRGAEFLNFEQAKDKNFRAVHRPYIISYFKAKVGKV